MKNCDAKDAPVGGHDAAGRAAGDLIHNFMIWRHCELTMVLVFGEWFGAA